MFFACYERTMRNARPVADNGIDLKRAVSLPLPQPAPRPVKRRRVIVRKVITQDQAAVLRQRQEANDSIREANIALGQFKMHVSSFATIMRRISKATGISPIDIFSPRRSRHVVFARQAVIYWCRRRTLLSLPQIGRHLNGRDHTTILHAYRIYIEKRARMGRKLRPLDQRHP